MKKIMIFIVIILISIQFINVEQTNPPVKFQMSLPDKVKSVIERACYDCHSNLTEWKWYSKIAPASFLISHQVKEGRKYLNFSDWNPYLISEEKIKQKIWEVILNEKMPPWTYRIVNSKGKLSEEEKRRIKEWALSRKSLY
jgi:hypothetical protein